MIRLLIADDHTLVREGIKRIVAELSDIEVVDEAVDSSELVRKCRASGVDVLLLDVSMPGRPFLETLRRLREELPSLRVLVLSMHPEEQYAVRALRAGAAGYLTKAHSPGNLEEAIRRVYDGRKYVTPSLAEKLAFALGPEAEGAAHEALSDREYEVMVMLAQGNSVKEIANVLALSPKTVSTYRARVFEKMSFDSNARLVRYAVEHGLID